MQCLALWDGSHKCYVEWRKVFLQVAMSTVSAQISFNNSFLIYQKKKISKEKTFSFLSFFIVLARKQASGSQVLFTQRGNEGAGCSICTLMIPAACLLSIFSPCFSGRKMHFFPAMELGAATSSFCPFCLLRLHHEVICFISPSPN